LSQGCTFFFLLCRTLPEAGQRWESPPVPHRPCLWRRGPCDSATDPSCISTTDWKICPATWFSHQTVGLNVGLVRMFKWTLDCISDSDGASNHSASVAAENNLRHSGCISTSNPVGNHQSEFVQRRIPRR